jgi:hypothetical protein
MSELPVEIMVEIAKKDISAWSALTGIPSFGRWTLTNDGHKNALEIIKSNLEVVETRKRKPPRRIPGQWRNVGDD